MLNKINTSSEDFLKIVDFYYEKENFNINIEIFKKLTNIYDEIKLDVPLYEKVFSRLKVNVEEEIPYRVDLDQMKKNFADHFLFLVKYLKNFSEETLSFLKVILHLDHILNNTGVDSDSPDLLKNKRISLSLYNSNGIFLISSPSNLKINTYVEFIAYIKKVSTLKTVNTRVNVHCSVCGLLFTKNVNGVQSNKMYNTFTLNNDRKLHNCQNFNLEDNSNFGNMNNNKLFREYSDPVLIRYLSVEVISARNSEKEKNSLTEGNNNLICIAKEHLISDFPIWENVKICGIVKTRRDGSLTNNSNNIDNFFEKIIDINNIEQTGNLINENNMSGNLLFSGKMNLDNMVVMSPFFTRLQITSEDIMKFQTLASYRSALKTFLLGNLVNPKVYSNFEFVNVISLYFILSLNIGLKFHIFDQSKTDSLKQSLQFLTNYSDYVIYHDNGYEDIVFNKEMNKGKSEEFLFKYGKVFNAHDKLLYIEGLTLNQSLTSFINLNMNNSSFSVISNSNESSNSFVRSEFKSVSSILTTSKKENSGGIPNANNNNSANIFNSLQGYDIVAFFSDKIDSAKDRKKTNQILDNQFNIRKRKYTDFSNEVTQRSLGGTQICGVSQIQGTQFNHCADKNFSLMNSEDLYSLDSQTITEFYKRVIKEDLDSIKKDNFLNFISTRDQTFLFKYISFVNEFVFPKISSANADIINNISLHLISCYSDLISYDLICFDPQGENLKNIIGRVAMINARMEMREEVEVDDITRAYLFAKEIVQQNFISCLNSKRETVNKGKKNKMSFVMEKIKQICSLQSRRTFNKSEVKEACEYANIKEDLDNIIENLNFAGFMIKLSGDEYQLTE